MKPFKDKTIGLKTNVDWTTNPHLKFGSVKAVMEPFLTHNRVNRGEKRGRCRTGIGFSLTTFWFF